MTTKELAIQKLIDDPDFDLNKHVGSMIFEFINNNILKLISEDIVAEKYLLEHLTPAHLYTFLKNKSDIDKYENVIFNTIENNAKPNIYGDRNYSDLLNLILSKKAENSLYKLSKLELLTYNQISTNNIETFINIIKHWKLEAVNNFSLDILNNVDEATQNEIISTVMSKECNLSPINRDKLIRKTINIFSAKNKLKMYELADKNANIFGMYCSCGLNFRQKFALSNHCNKKCNDGHKSLVDTINESIITHKAAPFMCDCGFWTTTSYGLSNHKNACKYLKT